MAKISRYDTMYRVQFVCESYFRVKIVRVENCYIILLERFRALKNFQKRTHVANTSTIFKLLENKYTH